MWKYILTYHFRHRISRETKVAPCLFDFPSQTHLFKQAPWDFSVILLTGVQKGPWACMPPAGWLRLLQHSRQCQSPPSIPSSFAHLDSPWCWAGTFPGFTISPFLAQPCCIPSWSGPLLSWSHCIHQPCLTCSILVTSVEATSCQGSY